LSVPYGTSEARPAQRLIRRLEAIGTAGAPAQEIGLGPLSRDDVGRLVADAVRCEAARAAPLAGLVHEKTGGNPFFVIQFLSDLPDEGLPAVHPRAAPRSWNGGGIQGKGDTAHGRGLNA